MIGLWIITGVVALLALAIFAEARAKKGIYRPLSQTQPKASDLRYDTPQPGKKLDLACCNERQITRLKDHEETQSARHRRSREHSQRERQRLEKLDRVRPWDANARNVKEHSK